MYRLPTGQVVTISLASLSFAFLFKSIGFGFRLCIFLALVFGVWNSHETILNSLQRVKDAYLAIRSWWSDERVDLKTLLKSLNKKPDALKNFRLNHKAIFKLPLSRKTLLKAVNENGDMAQDCTQATKSIIDSIEKELVEMNPKLTISASLIRHLNTVLDSLTGCDYTISVLADLIQSIDVAI